MKATYANIRHTIKSGDAFWTASNAIFPISIRLFTKSKVSHTGVFLKIWTRLFTVEMLEWKGCVLTLASVRLRDTKFWLGRLARKPTGEVIVEHALKDVGRLNYSVVGAILSPFIDTPTSDNICSEWTAKILVMDFSHLERWILPSDVLSKCDEVVIVNS